MRKTAYARRLRRLSTPPEVKVWRWLRDRRFSKLKFRRQVPIGPYIVDFYCAMLGLAIELGGAPHLDERQQEWDARRSADLAKRGITILRLWNDEVRDDPTAVADRILAVAASLTRRFAPPSPASGRGR